MVFRRAILTVFFLSVACVTLAIGPGGERLDAELNTAQTVSLR